MIRKGIPRVWEWDFYCNTTGKCSHHSLLSDYCIRALFLQIIFCLHNLRNFKEKNRPRVIFTIWYNQTTVFGCSGPQKTSRNIFYCSMEERKKNVWLEKRGLLTARLYTFFMSPWSISGIYPLVLASRSLFCLEFYISQPTSWDHHSGFSSICL